MSLTITTYLLHTIITITIHHDVGMNLAEKKIVEVFMRK
jgi:hypothetical protein